ncbi:MAG: RNA methyltransferase [Sphingobacteriales bacterium]|nr:MAG: RNA methyltransferase [Sphingobacteriales bacterium]
MLGKAQAKYIQSLSHKKFRDEENLFIAEGPKIAAEILQEKPHAVKQIYALDEWLIKNKNLVKNIDATAITPVNENELERISQLSTPNQVLLLVEKFSIDDNIDLNKELVIMLDAIQDPGNLGTIIRIADWFGVKHIICSADCADAYNTKVIQSTMGSIMRVNVLYKDLPAFLKLQKNVRIYAAVLEGTPIQKLSGEHTGILLIGNESKGISEELLQLANKKITISKKGNAESLNAAVATGIILSHLI